MKAKASIVVERKVEWVDTDASGHYHYTAAFRFFEASEMALYKKLGIDNSISGRVPRVHAEADFKSLLFFGDKVQISCVVEDVGNSSIKFYHEIKRGDLQCVTGRIIVVYVDPASGKPMTVPHELRQKLLTSGSVGEEHLEG
jgi:YbgC/YbaW family acyl-CoA thioester hydrolase